MSFLTLRFLLSVVDLDRGTKLLEAADTMRKRVTWLKEGLISFDGDLQLQVGSVVNLAYLARIVLTVDFEPEMAAEGEQLLETTSSRQTI